MKVIIAALLAATLLSACETVRPYPGMAFDSVKANHGEFGGFDIAKPLWEN